MGRWKSYQGRACRRAFIVGILLLVHSLVLGGENSTGKVAFPLEEVSGFDVMDLGHTCLCRSEPEPNVVYPAFSSRKPLYGTMYVDAEFANPTSGTPHHFALDESRGAGTGYDRLYLDLSRDGRLSDETPVAPLRELPHGALFKQKWVAPPVWFGYVTFSSTDADGTHSVETLPRLLINKQGQATLSFTATKARRGRIEIAGNRFNVTILNSHPLGTHWDRPGTVVRLEAASRTPMPYWFGSDRLMALHRIGDRYWRFSLTPAGDRFCVEPYAGELGAFRIDMGGWPLRRATFSGALLARDKAVAVGQSDPRSDDQSGPNYEIPVGDYTPGTLGLRWGPLSFSLAANGYSTEVSNDPNAAYPLHIGKGKPCLLSLSRKGNILFVAPGRGARLKPGDALQVTTVLVDAKSNAIVHTLRRQPHEEQSRTALALIGFMIIAPLGVWLASGKSRPQYRYLPLFSGIGVLLLVGYLGGLFAVNALLHSNRPGREKYEDLTPRVTIARANGQIVAQGAMPFS